jgi:hypothetical protein
MKVVQETADEINKMNFKGQGVCIPLQADLGTKANADDLAKKMMELEPKIHLLFNNAGLFSLS